MKSALQPYLRKRDFQVTSEPTGGKATKQGALSFVIQKHAATRLHYDFRLELDGTLKSWAVPKGPSLDPRDKRMAVHVEDHPLDYASFEGTIPKGQYGAGKVIVWDRGTWEPVGDARAGYRAGKLKFRLAGTKLHGGWTLVRMHGRAGERQEPWLLIKERDDAARPAEDFSVVEAEPGSVLSDLTIDDGPPATKTPTRGSPKPVATARKASPRAAAAATRSAKAPTDAPALPAGAVKARMPATLLPQLATLVSAPPSDGEWIYEIKFDGYRLLARVDGGEVRLFTRRGNDWSARMPGLVDAVRTLAIGTGWLDGEIVVSGADGVPDFNALQNAFESAHADEIRYFVFDLPYWNGHDLRQVPLVDRRALLAALVDRAPPQERIRFSQDFDSGPEELLQKACRMRLEGMIGKRTDATYVSRRSPTWIKLKCTQRQEFVVGGWTDPQGSRTAIGSLLLGIHDEAGQLRFAGGVGSGFDQKTLTAVKKALNAIPAEHTPFFELPRDVRGHWVQPKLVAEVSFGEWTPDGRIRHSVFHGLRDDKDAGAIGRERAATPEEVSAASAATAKPGARAKPAAKAGTRIEATREPNAKASPAAKTTATTTTSKERADATVAGLRISHPDRVVDRATGISKLEIVNYYLEVARLILPHLAKRPVSLVRAPAGLAGHLVFQRHAGALRIPELRELDPAFSPDHEPMVEVDSFTALIGAAQANVIEFHTWNATTRDPAHPDRIVFDLDPGEGVGWQQMREGAALLRSLLQQLGLESFLKTSGGKGLHVVVPVAAKEEWDTVRELARRIVEHMAATIPERFVAKSGPKNRVGRIFVDYLRNGFGATTACAWSARARPGLGVSVPCAWDELDAVSGGDHWTIRNAHERIEEHADPWRGYAQAKQSAAKAMKAIGMERATA
ncbi:MAG TPA: DNA ligase D [Caldimonas sp.]|jgi:bifunctional non-homologous end joining protein LigD|nr:DNA ligase D [Caldimonas sp.]HEX4234571.1 DNA ligase D [Caldimonas sp.]